MEITKKYLLRQKKMNNEKKNEKKKEEKKRGKKTLQPQKPSNNQSISIAKAKGGASSFRKTTIAEKKIKKKLIKKN